MLAQKGTRTIVVDAECPDGTAGWVAANHPAAHVVKLPDSAIFNLSRARNAGLAAVTTPWVCFIDADILLAPDFWGQIRPRLAPGQFYGFRNTREKYGITGTVIAETTTVLKFGGYDEAIKGYGGEDYEFYDSLTRLGSVRTVLEDSIITGVLQHGAQARTQYYEQKDTRFTIVVNGLYRILKKHVRNADPHIDFNLPQRQKIYAEALRTVERARDSGEQQIEIDVPLPPDPIIYKPYAELDQVLTLKLRLKTGKS
jgi:hypothetical protein